MAIALFTAAVVGGQVLWADDEETTPDASRNRLAILSTPNNGAESFLHIAQVGQPLPPAVAKLQHLPDAAVRGAVLPDGGVLVVADYHPGRDRSFQSALFRLRAHEQAIILCDQVTFAARPLVMPDGRVFVQRGKAGTDVLGELRVDRLSIDEVDPETGATRTIWTADGYFGYVAGAFRNDLIVYHMYPAGARLLLVDRDRGSERTLLPSLPPFATDFSVTENGDLIFQNRDNDGHHWVVTRVDLNTTEMNQLERSLAPLAPRAWPRGGMLLGSKGLVPRTSSLKFGAGEVFDVRDFSPDHRLAAALLYRKNTSAPDVVLFAQSGTELGRIAAPPLTRLEIAGFIQ